MRMPKKASALPATALMLMISACGTTDVANSETTEPEAAGLETAASATPSSDDCANDTTETSTGPVSLVDDLGRTVELEQPAERVVALEWQQVEDALTLCVPPVAVADPEGYSTWISAEDLPEGVADVGLREEPDLDAIFAADPDLIIVEAFDEEDETLQALEESDVPVLATIGNNPEDPIGNVKDVFSLIAEATGRTERAQQVITEFDEHLAQRREDVADLDLPTTDFVFFDGWVQGNNVTLRPYTDGSLFAAIGKELGLNPAWTDEVDQGYGDGGINEAYGLAQTDIEGLTAVGDANLFYSNGEATGYVDRLEESDIWTSLPAVEEGRAHEFPVVWGAGGPRSTMQAVDAFADALTQE